MAAGVAQVVNSLLEGYLKIKIVFFFNYIPLKFIRYLHIRSRYRDNLPSSDLTIFLNELQVQIEKLSQAINLARSLGVPIQVLITKITKN